MADCEVEGNTRYCKPPSISSQVASKGNERAMTPTERDSERRDMRTIKYVENAGGMDEHQKSRSNSKKIMEAN
ncbi:hypothetical protein TNCV_3713421 [Trichonephila clavipes]|nr:hypothetical protein TNCV_3713421 [Trichonephila clavipes]